MGKTKISWTEETWNPFRGCSRYSPGCENCYAETIAMRFSGPGQAFEGFATRGKGWTRRVELLPEVLAEALSWRNQKLVFISMSDPFHERLNNEEIAALFGVMAATRRCVTFQILTKRSKRAREWFQWLAKTAYESAPEHAHNRLSSVWALDICQRAAARELAKVDIPPGKVMRVDDTWPLPNVWIGASVENQDYADERIPELLATPAALRFLSCEPLLGVIDLRYVKHPIGYVNALTGGSSRARGRSAYQHPERIRWVIAGAESGNGARPCEVEWLRLLRNQCQHYGTKFWLKQAEASGSAVIGLGPNARQKKGSLIELPYLDGQQHAEMPEVFDAA